MKKALIGFTLIVGVFWAISISSDSKKQKFKSTLLTSNEFITMNDELKKTNQNMSNKHIMYFIKMLDQEQNQSYNNFCIRKTYYNLDNSVNKKRLLELMSTYTLWADQPADLSKMHDMVQNPHSYKTSTWLGKFPEYRCK